MILGIDPGARWIGYCLCGPRAGVGGAFNVKGHSQSGDLAQAISAYRKWLTERFEAGGIERVVIERPYIGRGHGVDFTSAILWITHEVAYKFGVERSEVSADVVRKWLLGHARKKKGQTEKEFDREIAGALAGYGYVMTSEHAADAAACGLWWACKNLPEFSGLPVSK